MSEVALREDLVRRLSAAIRSGELYAPTHPLVQRSIDSLVAVTTSNLQNQPNAVIGFLGNDIVVNDLRLGRFSAQLVGLVRDMHERQIEKISLMQGTNRDDLRHLVELMSDRRSPVPLSERLLARGVTRITIGRITIESDDGEHTGIAKARKVYNAAVETAENIWEQAKAGDHPDPSEARKIVDSLAKAVTQDRTSLMALSTLKKYDNYTFTHMVNVSVLAMSQARSLNLEGPILREFGFAALMHDIGKVNTPLEVLNKPGKLEKDEFEIMKRHVIDGAHILRKTPEMPALAPIVAFEHHLKQDLSGYPENIGHRNLNLCTMVVSIADVFDALRSNRPYRQGLATDRIRTIMGEQGNPQFNQKLLKRFVNIMGLYPIGNFVRLNTEEVGVVTAEHPTDPFRPQVKIVFDEKGERLEEAFLANTWERDSRGEYPRAVVEAIDPDSMELDPLTLL
ncbi:MAG TPA: HD domain-containing phosphohydrolase [Vicinamibacterales bacterium]|nr:HD domain-containing phosphohydrolase [Vicinamibacterales bacterium]